VGGNVSKLTLAEAISEFGADANAKLSNPAAKVQPEDQLRKPLENLFEALAELTGKAGMVTLVGETSLAGMQTRPDYSVTIGTGKAKALVGFIEVKAPGKGADPRKFKDQHDKEQWTKLKALPNILYTDGNGFSLWQDGELVSLVQLEGDIESDGAKLGAPSALLPLIESFLGWNPIPPRNAHALAMKSSSRWRRRIRLCATSRGTGAVCCSRRRTTRNSPTAMRRQSRSGCSWRDRRRSSLPKGSPRSPGSLPNPTR
jgi:hypothetical protein